MPWHWGQPCADAAGEAWNFLRQWVCTTAPHEECTCTRPISSEGPSAVAAQSTRHSVQRSFDGGRFLNSQLMAVVTFLTVRISDEDIFFEFDWEKKNQKETLIFIFFFFF